MYFYIGANIEGVWNSFQMSLPFEDVVNSFVLLYPVYEFLSILITAKETHKNTIRISKQFTTRLLNTLEDHNHVD